MITDIEFFFKKIRKREPFALIKCGDGEIIATIETEEKDYFTDVEHGIVFNPENPIDKMISAQLYIALTYADDNYYIGIPSKEKWREKIKPILRQDEDHLTKNDIYGLQIFEFLDKFEQIVKSGIKINWLCNELVEKNPPEFVDKFFYIKDNAWRIQYKEVIIDLLRYVDDKKEELFLFSAGIFSEVLIYYCWNLNKNNMYMDIGSVFDPFAFDKCTRNYQKNIEEELKQRKRLWKIKRN